MTSIGTMLKQLAGMVDTKDLNDWENQFVKDTLERTEQGKRTSLLTENQATKVEEIWSKHLPDNSKIEWTDATWNPVRGCSIVSKGCTNCYAMRQAHRASGAGGAYEGLTKATKGGPVWTGKVRLVAELLEQPLAWRRPRRIFVNSMSDLFHEDVPEEFIYRVWCVMAAARRHVFQILTKRPERVLEVLTGQTFRSQVLANVWLGVSVEDQAAADERIPLLLETPAAVRWISAEPLLGPVDLTKILAKAIGNHSDLLLDALDGRYAAAWSGRATRLQLRDSRIAPLSWVVAGGESGPGARPMHPDWARSLRDQCAGAGVPFFFKQWGAWAPLRLLDSLHYRGTAIDTEGKPVPLENLPLIVKGGASMVAALKGRTHLSFIGKNRAGRQLDGRTHDEYPEVRSTTTQEVHT